MVIHGSRSGVPSTVFIGCAGILVELVIEMEFLAVFVGGVGGWGGVIDKIFKFAEQNAR